MTSPRIDPTSTAVLFVECQRGLIGDQTIMKTIRDAAVDQLELLGRLAAGARTAGARVVHLTYFPVAGNRSSNRRPPLFARLNDAMDEWHRDHPACQPIPEIGVEPTDLVLPRNTGLSPTYGTETYKLLRNIGVETVVLAGISANVAIPVAGTEAADEDFDVVFVTDAIVGAPVEHRDSILRNTLPFIGHMRTVDELLAHWGVSA